MYEYKIETANRWTGVLTIKEINVIAEKGWRLVAALGQPGGKCHYYFERKAETTFGSSEKTTGNEDD